MSRVTPSPGNRLSRRWTRSTFSSSPHTSQRSQGVTERMSVPPLARAVVIGAGRVGGGDGRILRPRAVGVAVEVEVDVRKLGVRAVGEGALHGGGEHAVRVLRLDDVPVARLPLRGAPREGERGEQKEESRRQADDLPHPEKSPFCLSYARRARRMPETAKTDPPRPPEQAANAPRPNKRRARSVRSKKRRARPIRIGTHFPPPPCGRGRKKAERKKRSHPPAGEAESGSEGGRTRRARRQGQGTRSMPLSDGCANTVSRSPSDHARA